jgi:hypothetical protein
MPRLDGMLQHIKVTRDELFLPQVYQIGFQSVLDGLRVFGENIYNAFDQGFQQNWLELDQNIPKDTVLNTIINRMAEDLDVIRAASSQRKNPDFCAFLEYADELAFCSLQLAFETGLLADAEKDVTVFTYFRQTPNVRVLPYVKAMFIGIPYTSKPEKQDLLAIPHEVGHYVFWKSKAGEQINNYLGAMPAESGSTNVPESSYIKNWAEEIFSDIYGCMVAGKEIALDFQDFYLRRYATDDLNKDDGEHPNTLIRPYIGVRVFENLAQTEWASETSSQWEDKLAERSTRYEKSHDPVVMVSGLSKGRESLKRSEIIAADAPLFKIVDRICNETLKAHRVSPDFADMLANLDVDKIIKVSEANRPLTSTISWNDFIELIKKEEHLNPNQGIASENNTSLDVWKTLAKATPATVFPSTFSSVSWRNVLIANGWVTKGPWSKR